MPESIAHFERHGWMRVPGGMAADQARAMEEALWAALAQAGIVQDAPASWTVERPTHLQALRQDPAFAWRPALPLAAAIDAIIGPGYPAPPDWGSAFVAFPGSAHWGIVPGGWHIDANYRGALLPARGVRILALLAPVGSRGGATQILSGSHRLIHDWFARNPSPATAKSPELRRSLRAHPYLAALQRPGDEAKRIERFLAPEDWDGITLQVVELTGDAGEVFLLHPLLLHAAAPNAGSLPRLMVSGGVTTDQWGWAPG